MFGYTCECPYAEGRLIGTQSHIAISIIVPVYNTEDFLIECLESIAAQRVDGGLEVILVDDGSTDGSGRICDEYASRDARFIVIHQQNGGLSAARNAGIDHARGEYLMFVDSDDFVREGFCSVPLALAREHDADIVVFDSDRVDETGRVLDARYQWYRMHVSGLLNREEALCALARHDFFDFAWNKLYRREVFDGVRYPEGEYWEDMAISYILVDHARRVFVTRERLYCYRYREGSLSQESTYSASEKVCERSQDAFSYLVERCPAAASIMEVRTAKDELVYLRQHCGELGDEYYNSIIGHFIVREVPGSELSRRERVERWALWHAPKLYPPTAKALATASKLKRTVDMLQVKASVVLRRLRADSD